MRTPIIRMTGALLAVAGGALLPALPAVAAPTPSPGAVTVTRAGTSFLTATGIDVGQPVRLDASTGDYLYWSFTASAGQTHDITITVTLPKKGRSGAETWTVDVFDGLRRRQACTAGAQTPTAGPNDAQVTLGCTLRQVRSWAEPWSGDPLPGTYYIRLSLVDLPEQDLGLPVAVDLLVGAEDDDDPTPEDAELKAPLVPAAKPGAVLTAEPTAADSDDEEDGTFGDWLPDLSSRWIWTAVGGVLAAIAGVVGFSLTWRPRR